MVGWRKSKINYLDVLGKEMRNQSVWNDEAKRYITKKVAVDLPEVHENLDFVTECYH